MYLLYELCYNLNMSQETIEDNVINNIITIDNKCNYIQLRFRRDWLVYNIDFSAFEAIRGRYHPDRLNLFVDATAPEKGATELPQNDNIVLFHETFHHWQILMTYYGQLKWMLNRDITSEIYKIWIESTDKLPNKKPLPIGYLVNSDNVECIKGAVQIYMQKMILDILHLLDYKNPNISIASKYGFGNFDIVPTIKVRGVDYELNGIDIIECFAKHQEAVYALHCYDIPMKETLDPNKLPTRYYYPFIYFLENVELRRIIEFPVICELSLQMDSLAFPNNEKLWKNNHPAWRFIALINALRNNKDIPYLDFHKLDDSYKNYSSKLLQYCGYKSLDDIMGKMLNEWSYHDLFLEKQMKRAIEFKNDHPSALAYPLANATAWKKMIKYSPPIYQYRDLTQYTLNFDRDEELGLTEVVLENHLQALMKQIIGEVSDYSLDVEEIQCGFAYYGLYGCPYQKSGECNGSINPKEGLKCKFSFDENIETVQGCSFGIFLYMKGISVSDIDIKMQYKSFPSFDEIQSKLEKIRNDI